MNSNDSPSLSITATEFFTLTIWSCGSLHACLHRTLAKLGSRLRQSGYARTTKQIARMFSGILNLNDSYSAHACLTPFEAASICLVDFFASIKAAYLQLFPHAKPTCSSDKVYRWYAFAKEEPLPTIRDIEYEAAQRVLKAVAKHRTPSRADALTLRLWAGPYNAMQRLEDIAKEIENDADSREPKVL
jgi:hypothetical protein